jgi:hypothetical protein
MPVLKTTGEAVTGVSTFPDVFDPRPIRDSAEHMASLLIPRDWYKKLTGKPTRDSGVGDMLLNLLTYSTDPGEAAYYTVRNMASEWQKERGEDPGSFKPSARANALYYHKQAIKYGDKELAEKYLARYMAMGGKEEGIERSIEASHPIGFMGKIDKATFVMGLKGDELKVYKRAAEWYFKTYHKPVKEQDESEVNYQARLKEFNEEQRDHITPIVADAATAAAELTSGVGQPERKTKSGRFTETPEDYQKRLDPWLEKQAAAQKWLDEHAESTVVQEAVSAVGAERRRKRLGRRRVAQ